MPITYDGDVIIITGAANGIGREYALLLASRGARVVVNDIGGSTEGNGSDETAAAKVVKEITDAGGVAIAQTSDGSTLEGAKAITEDTLEAFGRIDGLISNAGILRDKTFLKVSDEDFWKVVDVHLGGTMRTIHAAWPIMREQGYGRVVTTTSGAGLFANFGQANYAAAKMAIVGLTKVLALEGAKYGVTANVIAPAANTRLANAAMPPDLQGKMDPAQVAPVGAYLVHPSSTVTGEIFSVGMGRVARVRTGVGAGVHNEVVTLENVEESMDEILADEISNFPSDAFGEIALIMGMEVVKPGPELIGTEFGGASFTIDRSKVYELANAVQDPDPAYERARFSQADDADVPVPINWPVLYAHWIDPMEMITSLKLDLRRVLHGGSAWVYHAPVKIGDRITARQRVRDVTERAGKRGGHMTMIDVETAFTNQDDTLVCTETATIIETS